MVGLNKQEFSDALSRVSICSNSSSLIRMNIIGENAIIEANNADFGKSASEELHCFHEDVDIAIGFKCDSMMGLIGNIAAEDVLITMSTPDRAITVKDNEMPNKVLLVMPCLLN
jgi:DNA polymerase-3 subunit beta